MTENEKLQSRVKELETELMESKEEMRKESQKLEEQLWNKEQEIEKVHQDLGNKEEKNVADQLEDRVETLRFIPFKYYVFLLIYSYLL